MSQPPSQGIPSAAQPIPAPAPTIPYANPAGQFVPNGDQAARAIKLIKAFIVAGIVQFPIGVAGTWFFLGMEDQSSDKFTAAWMVFFVLSAIVNLTYGILYLISAVFYLTWLHRACWNVRALGAGGLTITPAWAVGWWFIPIANLVMPYRACKELLLASLGLTTPTQSDSPSWLIGWWACWICSGIAGQLAPSITSISNGVPFRAATTALHMLSLALTIGAGLFCFRFIRTVESAQLAATSQPAA